MLPILFRFMGATSVLLASLAQLSCDSAQEQPQAGAPGRPGAPRPATPGAIEQVALVPAGPVADGQPLFTSLDPQATGIDFTLRSEFARHAKEFMFITPLGGVCAGDYDGDGLPDVYLTSASGGNRLFRNLGGFRFDDVTAAAGVEDTAFWGTGASFVDIDNDGDLDLFACGYDQPNKCYINVGNGRFEDRARQLQLDFDGASMMMSFADIDNDGDLDGYLATTAKAPPPGTKFGVVYEGEKPVIPEPLQEYWQFLYLPGKKVQRTEAGQFDRLFRNDGGRFTEVARQSGIDGPYFTLSATWWDSNADGRPDLYVSNDYTGPDMLYVNVGNGRFENRIGEAVPHTPWFSMGSDIGDVNNDGLVDFFASDMAATTHYRDKMMMGNMDDMGWFLEYAEPRQYMRNALYLNTGTGRMMEASFLCGLSSTNWTWSPRLEDLDSDGRIDLFVTNGILRDSMNSDLSAMAAQRFQPGSAEWAQFWANQPLFKEQNLAFRNDGGLRFTNASALWGLNHTGVSFGSATADLDGDGDLDLIVNNAEEQAKVYRNETTSNRVRVRLVGTESNRSGFGAHVRITTSEGVQVRYLTSARGWLSASEPVLHFGLGQETGVQALSVQWPSGHVQEFRDLPANHLFVITEPGGVPADGKQAAGPGTLFAASTLLREAAHKEDPFDDFARQPLLPNKLSQSGPAMAWGDVDGDGDADGFLGGSAGYPGQLLIHENGRFTLRSVFAEDARSEDTAAQFFDADGDGDPDLYVVSGSVEQEPGDAAYRDRLYLNDGRGGFTPAAADALPDFRDSGGCVAAADHDQDGDLDLFVGGRSIPGRYPEAPGSHLLVNDGSGRFTDATPPALAAPGMVTAALWSDVDGDGWTDLLITHEWGPVRVFRNDSGQLADATGSAGLGDLLGWWNGIAAGDVDGDADTDLVVTNYGLNTKYSASRAKPAMLYYGDFDGSGNLNLVEAKFEGNTALPRRGFSCSSGAMPFLKDKVKTFHNFASSTLDALYPLASGRKWEANTLESGILINDGGGGFTFRPLPRLAQIAPAFGVALHDVDGDGHLDCLLAQNSYSPQRETGHMDGGLSLLLMGDGTGGFHPVWPARSGISVAADAVGVALPDLNGDGRADVVFSVNNGMLQAFEWQQ